jgi:hypothetical protein
VTIFCPPTLSLKFWQCARFATQNSHPSIARRILANRQSAQRSRVRKLQYISELERSVTSLQVRACAQPS